MEPCFLTAADAAVQIRKKTLTSETLVRSCLERIAARDAAVRAWVHVDPAYAIAQARELDKRPVAGPLHGLPFGVKDMVDTADMPTTQNSPLYQGQRPTKDAGCVTVVRHSGALILGKTDTVEFAAGGRKALTRNAHNLAHTPGGSSSGSGAAVADSMVPLAFGTQTGGSLIRPAAFNGIYALKPTWGAVTREGAKLLSATCDTVGWYGRSVADLALVAEAFRLRDLSVQKNIAIKGLRVALCQTPYWSKAEPRSGCGMSPRCRLGMPPALVWWGGTHRTMSSKALCSCGMGPRPRPRSKGSTHGLTGSRASMCFPPAWRSNRCTTEGISCVSPSAP